LPGEEQGVPTALIRTHSARAHTHTPTELPAAATRLATSARAARISASASIGSAPSYSSNSGC
jgi:hypothetical protein